MTLSRAAMILGQPTVVWSVLALVALGAGIATVYQDLAMVPLMSVWRNFFLGSEPTKNLGPFKWIDQPKAKAIAKEDGVLFLLHGWLAGGFASKDRCITSPDDVKGMQMRAAGKAFEQMLAGAGASITSMPSSEIYNAMQTGVLDGANTSSSSFVSFRIYEQVQCYTPASDFALWFMYHPLILSEASWNNLSPEQQKAMQEGAVKAEAFFFEQAKMIDANSVEVYEKNGVEIANMTQEEFDAWRDVAQETSYKNFTDEVDGGQALLDKALSVE